MTKTEIWNGYEIRFVEVAGEWWAVAKDVCDALALKNPRKAVSSLKGVTKGYTLTDGGEQEVNLICEKDIYRLVFKSRKPEAEAFQDWVFETIKELRTQLGLEGFEVFRMLDKEHQKQAMANLQKSLSHPVRVDFIKANTIANKAVSNKYGYPKALKKSQTSPQMLADREPILNDTVELMGTNEKFNLGVHVSTEIYKRVGNA